MRLIRNTKHKTILTIIYFVSILALSAQENSVKASMPLKGICAHRGASETHPENTLFAFNEAIRLGAQMIEFDVRMTKDNQLVIMHDRSVDRTTNGTGLVNELTLMEIKQFDAGVWKSKEFLGEKVPTFKEVLDIMPNNIWLNIHLKGGSELGKTVPHFRCSENRIHQGIIACGIKAAEGIKQINSNVLICNMERLENRNAYVYNTIKEKYNFIQLLKKRDNNNLLQDINRLKKNHIMLNYYFGDTETEVKYLFEIGIDFILTNKLSKMLKIAENIGIERVTEKK